MYQGRLHLCDCGEVLIPAEYGFPGVASREKSVSTPSDPSPMFCKEAQ